MSVGHRDASRPRRDSPGCWLLDHARPRRPSPRSGGLASACPRRHSGTITCIVRAARRLRHALSEDRGVGLDPVQVGRFRLHRLRLADAARRNATGCSSRSSGSRAPRLLATSATRASRSTTTTSRRFRALRTWFQRRKFRVLPAAVGAAEIRRVREPQTERMQSIRFSTRSRNPASTASPPRSARRWKKRARL